MTERPTGERIIIPRRLRKQMRWAAPIDDFGNFDHQLFPAFPDSIREGDELKSKQILQRLPPLYELEKLKSALECLGRRIEASQINRLLSLRWHAVQCLENLERYDVLTELDPV